MDSAIDDEGGFHVVWRNYSGTQGDPDETVYSRYDGIAWLPPEVVQCNSTATPAQIGADSHGRPHVVWETQDWPGRLRYRTKVVGQWSPPVQLNMDSQVVDQNSSDVAVSPVNDEMHTVWISTASGHSEVFYNHAYVGATNDVHPPSVSVTAPTTGAVLPIGSSFAIQWSAVDGTTVAGCDLAYTTNGGASWLPIASNVENSGACPWTVPNIGSATGQVRVTAHDLAGNAGSGFSAFFTVADLTPPTISLLAPTSGVVLVGGTATNILWLATDNASVSGIALDYSLDAGNTWFSIATNLANTGNYAWTIPNTATLSLLLRATAKDTAGFIATVVSAQPMSIVRANNPPIQPYNPFPLANGVSAPTVAPNLQWLSGDADGDSLTYRVYMGTNASPQLITSVSVNSFAPGLLRPQQVYYWQVVASDGKANTPGPMWSFATESAETPRAHLADFDQLTPNQFNLSIEGILGENYRVEFSSNLVSSSWNPLTNVIATNGAVIVPVSFPTNCKAGYWRAVGQ
jgi:hypothetical protein